MPDDLDPIRRDVQALNYDFLRLAHEAAQVSIADARLGMTEKAAEGSGTRARRRCAGWLMTRLHLSRFLRGLNIRPSRSQPVPCSLGKAVSELRIKLCINQLLINVSGGERGSH